MKRRSRAFGAVGAWAVVVLAAQAAAQNVTAEDPRRILTILEAAGYPGQIVTTAYGDPEIRAEAGGVPFQLRFYGCRNGAECQSVQFIAGFAQAELPLDAINEWNRATRYGRVYEQDGNAFIAHDLNLDGGGVPEDSFRSSLALWDQGLRRFMARLGW